jgi:hypothetical protein
MKLVEFDWGDYDQRESFEVLRRELKGKHIVLGTDGKYGLMLTDRLDIYEARTTMVGENSNELVVMASKVDSIVAHIPTLLQMSDAYKVWEQAMRTVAKYNRRVILLTQKRITYLEASLEAQGCLTIPKMEADQLLPFALATLFLAHPTDF